MGATRPASGIKAKVHTPNKDSQTTLITRLSVSLCLKIPRDASPPLVLAFGACDRSYVFVFPDANYVSYAAYVPAVNVMAKSYCDLPLTREHKNKSPCPYVLKFFCSYVLLSLC